MHPLHPMPTGYCGPASWPSSPPASASPSAAESSTTGVASTASPALELGAIGGAGFTGFCFGIIIGGVIADKNRLRQTRHRGLPVPRRSRRSSRSAPTPRYERDTSMLVPVWRHVHLRHRQRHARGRRQSARRHALPAQPHALPQHPARQLAGRTGARRRLRVGARRPVQLSLEAAVRPLPDPDGALRPDVPRPEDAEVGSRRRRASSSARCSRTSASSAAWSSASCCRCSSSSLLTADAHPRRRDCRADRQCDSMAQPRLRVGGVLLVAVAVITKFSIGSFLLFVLFVTHALVGAVELGTDGWIQNITGNILSSQRRQDPLRLHVVGDVRPAVLCPLHREEARALADRHSAGVRRPGLRRPATDQPRSRRSASPWSL